MIIGVVDKNLKKYNILLIVIIISNSIKNELRVRNIQNKRFNLKEVINNFILYCLVSISKCKLAEQQLCFLC